MATFAFFLALTAPGGQRWHLQQLRPFLQPCGFQNQAQGSQAPAPWPTEPTEGNSGSPSNPKSASSPASPTSSTSSASLALLQGSVGESGRDPQSAERPLEDPAQMPAEVSVDSVPQSLPASSSLSSFQPKRGVRSPNKPPAHLGQPSSFGTLLGAVAAVRVIERCPAAGMGL